MKERIQAGLSNIKFSVNAATPEIYKMVHGKDDFDAVKNNIKSLRNYITKNGIDLPIFISFVKNNINKDEVSALYSSFDNLVDNIYIFQCANQAGGMLELISNDIVSERDLQPGSNIPCEMVFNRLHVTYEGYLNACCADVNGYLSAVDLHNTTLLEAWNSEILKDLRKQHLNHRLSHNRCYNCINNKEVEIIPLNANLVQF